MQQDDDESAEDLHEATSGSCSQQSQVDNSDDDEEGEAEDDEDDVSPSPSFIKLIVMSEAAVAVLITGGGGYLGYHIGLDLVHRSDILTRVILYDLVEPLPVWRQAFETKRGGDSINEQDIIYVQGDICDYKKLSSTLMNYNVSGIIHTASYGMSGTSNLPAYEDVVERVNLEGTRNVIRAATEAKVEAMVYTSTVNVVYHGQPIYHGRESLLHYPDLSAHTDHYSRTKQIAEELSLTASGRALGDGRELHTCSLRMSGIYGPHEQRHLPRVIATLKSGMIVAGYGYDTKQDLVHRDNAVQAHVKALNSLLDCSSRCKVSGNAYFVSEGNPVNNLLFFFEPLIPAIRGRDAKPPSFQLPIWLLLWLSLCVTFLSRIFGKCFTLPSWGLTPTEVYKTGVSHTFSYEEAKRDFGYDPEVKWTEEHWEEILNSYGLRSPRKIKAN